jgi:hypothetical protein
MSDLISNGPGTPSRRLRRFLPGVGAAAAVGLGLALGAVGISAAASPSPSPGSSTVQPQYAQPGQPGQPGPGGLRGPGRGMRPEGHGRLGDALGLRGAVRGDVVVPNGKGGYQTIRMQRGKVTDTGKSSITVLSADNHSETYDVPATALVNAARDGLGSIAVGDQVVVRALVAGDTVTATHIRDLTQLGADRPKGPPPGPNGTPASPSTYRS